MQTSAAMYRAQIVKVIEAEYLLGFPDGYDRKRKRGYPLILYLHGAGERGCNIDLIRSAPILAYAEKHSLPFVILAPQCREKAWWDLDTLSGLLDTVIVRENVDEDRLYVTGLSMGGQGTWMMANAFPGRFAALAPICGPELRTRDARNFKSTPVWCFHGARDEAVPLRDSIRMVDAIRGEGGQVRFTVYPDAGHDAWTETYNNPELYKWFLEHKRRKTPAASRDRTSATG